ncbi:MAG: WD40 repeat domain-containing protein [Gemmataceae bacterium]|nr:WD40 repeat domain-containing protein [Gemmataceae bacterium]
MRLTPRLPAAGIVLLIGLGGRNLRADETPLPAGAKARFGLPPPAVRAGVFPVPPDYKAFLVPDAEGQLRAYDVATGKPRDDGPPARPEAGSAVVAVSADGKRAAVARAGVLVVRDVATGGQLAEVRPAVPTVQGGATLSADGAVLAYGTLSQQNRGGEVVVWDVAKNAQVGRVPSPQPGVPLPTLSPDGKVVAVRGQGFTASTPAVARPGAGVAPAAADTGPTVAVWEATGGKELFKAPVGGTAGPQSGVAFSPDGKLLAVGSGEGPIDLWEVPSGKPVKTLLGRTGQGAKVAFAPDGKLLAAVGTDGAVQRWTLPDGKPVGATDPPADLPPVLPAGVAVAADGRAVAWASTGVAPVVWDAPSGKLLTPAGEHTGAVRSIAFAAGGKELVTAGSDGRVVRWEAATGKPLGRVRIAPGSRPGLAGGLGSVGTGGRYFFTLAADGTRALAAGMPPVVFDLATGAELFAVPRGAARATVTVHHLPSADLSRVAVLATTFDGRTPGRCTVWDLANPRRVAEFDLPASGGYAPAAAFSPDGTRLVTVTSLRDSSVAGGGGIRQGTLVTGWDLSTGKKLGEVEDPTMGVAGVAVVDDSVAVVVSGGRLWAVDYEAGRTGDVVEPAGPQGDPASGVVAVAPGGKRLAAAVAVDPAAGVYGVRVYDWPRGTVLHTLAGHAAPVTGLRFSPDGKLLATGSADTTVLLWDLAAIPDGK